MKISYLFMALAVVLFSGCSRKIEGEAFIVTKDRSTIKLSLLEVLLIPKEAYQAFRADMEPKLQAAERRNTKNLEDIAAVTDEILKVGRDFEPIHKETEQLSKAVPEVLDDRNLAHDAKVRWATNAQARMKELDALAAPHVAKIKELKEKHDALQADVKRIDAEMAALHEGVTSIPGTIRVKTNSDAKFSFSVPRGEYVVFAQTERKVFDDTEKYTWLVENVGEFVALNNDNLTK